MQSVYELAMIVILLMNADGVRCEIIQLVPINSTAAYLLGQPVVRVNPPLAIFGSPSNSVRLLRVENHVMAGV
jgi:hypothetical protein